MDARLPEIYSNNEHLFKTYNKQYNIKDNEPRMTSSIKKCNLVFHHLNK